MRNGIGRVIITNNYDNNFTEGDTYTVYSEGWLEYIYDDNGKKLDFDTFSRLCDWKRAD